MLPILLVKGQGLLAESHELLLLTCVLKLIFDAAGKSLVKGLGEHSIIVSSVGCVQVEGDNVFCDTGIVWHLKIMQCTFQCCVEVRVAKHQKQFCGVHSRIQILDL